MVVYDIEGLINRFFSDGFTVNCLCRATNVSSRLIEKVMQNEQLTADECLSLKPVLYFLTQLYAFDTSVNSYLSNLITAMCEFYDIPIDSICTYLGVDKKHLKQLITEGTKSWNETITLVKLLHLFTSLVRQKDQ